MKKRPALKAFLLLLPGFLAADRIGASPPFVWGATAAATAALLMAGRKRWKSLETGSLLLLPSLLFLAHTLPLPPRPKADPYRTIVGEVVARGAGGGRCRVRLSEGEAAGRDVTLRLPRGKAVPSIGAHVRAIGFLVPYPVPRNPGAPDLFGAERWRGGIGLFRAERAGSIAPRGAIARLRRWIVRRAERLGGREESLFLALFLARRDRLDPALVAAFREAGLSHLLALSGLHLGILFGIVSAPLSLLPLPARWKPLLVVLLLWGFGAVAAYPVSLVRALVMATLFAAGRAIERPTDRWNALGTAALVAIALDRGAAWDLSFRLSFAATAGVLAVLPAVARLWRHAAGRFIAAPLLVGAAAQGATLPVVLHHFHVFAPLGAVATLAATPFAALAIAAGSAWTVAGPIHPLVDRVLGDATWGAFALLAGAAGAARDLSPALHSITIPEGTGRILLVSGGALLLARRARGRGRLPLLFAFVVVAALLFVLPRRPPLRITILDVGQGSAALVEFPGGESLLIDAGPRAPGWDAGERILLPALRARHAIPADLLLVSHADADHAGGAGSLLERGAVRRLLTGGSTGGGEETHSDSLAQTGRFRDASVLEGGAFAFPEGGAVEILAAPEGRGTSGESNENSLVVGIRYGRFYALFPGDATPRMERRLARLGRLRDATLLVVPHHGARGGCTPPFTRALRPSLAVFSVGRANRYGHPDGGVLRRLEAAGAAIFRTDRDGAITVCTDGRRVEARGALPGSPRRTLLLRHRPASDRAFP